jgi:hypothetical protein
MMIPGSISAVRVVAVMAGPAADPARRFVNLFQNANDGEQRPKHQNREHENASEPSDSANRSSILSGVEVDMSSSPTVNAHPKLARAC